MAEDLEAYFEEILRILSTGVSTNAAVQSQPVFEALADQIGKLRATIVYEDGSELNFFLAVDFVSGYPDWTHYTFHYMDRNKACRFRYDDFPHYPDLPQFPHHKHEGASKVIMPCNKPSVHQIQSEIGKWLRPP